MLNNQIRSIAAAAVGAALGLTGASSVQAQTLDLLYEFGSYQEAKVAVDHAGNLMVAAPFTGRRDTLDVCEVSDPEAVACQAFSSTVLAGPPGTLEAPADVDFDGAGNVVIAERLDRTRAGDKAVLGRPASNVLELL